MGWTNSTNMTELHPTSDYQIITEPFSKARRVTGAPEPRSLERTRDSAPIRTRSIHGKWEMLVIWGFVVFSFAAFFSCGFILWLKCHGD